MDDTGFGLGFILAFLLALLVDVFLVCPITYSSGQADGRASFATQAAEQFCKPQCSEGYTHRVNDKAPWLTCICTSEVKLAEVK